MYCSFTLNDFSQLWHAMFTLGNFIAIKFPWVNSVKKKKTLGQRKEAGGRIKFVGRPVRSSGSPWPAAVERTWTSQPGAKKRDKATLPAAAPQKGGNRTRKVQ